MSILEDKITAIADLLAGIDATRRDGLDTTQALRMIRDTADSALVQAVEQARHEHASWTSIARMLGTSRQAAWERYTNGSAGPAPDWTKDV